MDFSCFYSLYTQYLQLAQVNSGVVVMKNEEKKSAQNRSFAIGAVAVVFLVIGYQTALLVHSAAVAKVAANRDEPDTVYVYGAVQNAPLSIPTGVGSEEPSTSQPGTRKKSSAGYHTPKAERIRSALPRRTESFKFNPNTVSKDELQRLGFSEKQAQSIINYREKGGRFRRKTDFAKSYVVADSVYKRLESYIDIPLLDINLADSAAFDALPGIGGWFASRMVAHRKALGGYSYKEQLMDIKNFDHEKFVGLEDLITVTNATATPYPLWALPADSLKKHPYIKNYETARSIVFFRDNSPKENWTVENLGAAGILSSDQTAKLSRCLIASPSSL